MQMSGEQAIAAPRARVWEALNDPEVLKQCIPGCQSLEKQADDRFAAVAEVKIGPIGARFKGDIHLSDLDAPNGYTITGSGNGGIAGSARGGAKVRLSDAPGGGTLVHYDVDAEVGGRMAQLGGPIIDATARNLAGKFFSRFGEVVGASDGNAATAATTTGAATADSPTHPAPAAESTVASAAVPAPRPSVSGASPAPAGAGTFWGWIVALIVTLYVGYTLGRFEMGSISVLVCVLMLIVAAVSYEAGRRGGGR